MKTQTQLPQKVIEENKWVCICENAKNEGFVDSSSLSYTRTNSIKKFVGDGKWNWNWWRRRGWRCVRVNITYEIQIKS